MLDLKQLDKRLSGADPALADAVRFVYIDTNLGLEDTRRTLSDRLQSGLMEGALGAFEQDAALGELRQQVNAQRSNEFAPPGLTDAQAMTPEGAAALPALIQELSVNETTGALQYKARRERHTMGSLTQRDTDADWTALAGLVAQDTRLAAGASEWQLARWNHATGVKQWQPFDLGADGTFLKSKGPGVAPEWTDTLPLSLHAWSHTSHHWDATANGGAGAWVASDDTIQTATVNHTGLLRALLADDPAVKFLRSDGTWAIPPDTNTFSPLGTYAAGNVIEYGTVDDIEGWWSVSGGYERVLAWLSTYERAEGVPLQPMIPVRIPRYYAEEGIGEPELISDNWEIAPLRDIIGGPYAAIPESVPDKSLAVWSVDGDSTLLSFHHFGKAHVLPFWGGETGLEPVAVGDAGQFLKSNGAGEAPGFAALPAATTSAAGVIGPLPAQDAATKYLDGTGAFVVPAFSASGHTHPYVPLDYDYPLAEVLSWLTEAATAADDPWQMLVLKPVSNGYTPETFSYQTSTETITAAIMGAGINDASTLYPKYLRIVKVGDVDTLEWEDICDDDAQTKTLAYWKEDGKLGVIAPGTTGHFLQSAGTGTAPAFAALPAATTSAAGVIQLETSATDSKYLNGAGQWTTPPNTNTWPGYGGTEGQVWTSQGDLDTGHWADAPGTDWPAFADDDFPQMLVGEMSTGETPVPVYSWKTLIKQIVDGVGEGTPVNKSIMLWDTSTGKLKAYHATSTKSLLYWDGNNGLTAIGAATADKQVLRWNFDGETSVGPSWAPQEPAVHHLSHCDSVYGHGDDLIPVIRETYSDGTNTWAWADRGLCPATNGTATNFLCGDGTWKPVPLPQLGTATQTVTLCSNVTYDLTSRQLRKFTRVLSFDADGRLVSIGDESAASVIEQAVSMLGT